MAYSIRGLTKELQACYLGATVGKVSAAAPRFTLPLLLPLLHACPTAGYPV